MERIHIVKDKSFPTNFISYLNIPFTLSPNNVNEKDHKNTLKIINAFINYSISYQNVHIPTTNNKYNILHFLNGIKIIVNILNRQQFSRELEGNNEIISEARKKIILKNRCNNNQLQRFYFEANDLINYQHKKINLIKKNVKISNILSKIVLYVLLLKKEQYIGKTEFLIYKKFLFFKNNETKIYPKVMNMANFFNNNKETFQSILLTLESYLKKFIE